MAMKDGPTILHKEIKAMSKELESLEHLMNNCCDTCSNEVCGTKRNNGCSHFRNYKIIETALKNYENSQRIETEVEKYYYKTLVDNENKKKLKALDIIKEKGVLQFCMLGVSLNDYNESVDISNKEWPFQNYKHLTQEEFDLLKEVLCK